MITPLGKGRRNKLWFQGALLYTSGGAISSSLIGAAFGLLGKPLHLYFDSKMLWVTAAALVCLLALRDSNVVRFALPQKKCQAPYEWFHRFDFGSVLFMWGFQIGVGASTFIVFSGFYAVAVIATLSGRPLFGAALTLSYWLGRALSVWFAPSVLGSWPMQEASRRGLVNPRLFRMMSVGSLILCIGILGWMVGRT